MIIMVNAGTILVTGGSGYVGSHCIVELLNNDFNVIVIDNLVNSVCLHNDESKLPESLIRVQKITNRSIDKFYNGSIEDYDLLERIFTENESIDVVMHFAALKAVGESCRQPLRYYRNNVCGAITLLSVMEKFQVKKFIFSSSATVYGQPQYLPIDESHPIGIDCTNPYGRSKCMVEQILDDVCKADEQWSVISLRYFNPIGAHESGLIGEDPNDEPNNLMPYISQVAIKLRSHLNIFGNDYPTIDGTGVRDYIHIDDLSNGHLIALKQMFTAPENWCGYNPVNLGTGLGTSVLQLVKSFEKSNGIRIPYKFVERRTGDLATIYADVKLANERLKWKATKTIDEMCSSTWNWQTKNPNGYRTVAQCKD